MNKVVRDCKLQSICNKRYPSKLNQIRYHYENFRKGIIQSRSKVQEIKRQANSTGRMRSRLKNQRYVTPGERASYHKHTGFITNRGQNTTAPEFTK